MPIFGDAKDILLGVGWIKFTISYSVASVA